ncbi:hypothetical protein SK128_011751 [Halocaridina rubra]|uniref:Failed axon connections n=1 Tax=Halocaridina rubra TaxID=373956 RepID=A0AAN8WWY1_HALRR
MMNLPWPGAVVAGIGTIVAGIGVLYTVSKIGKLRKKQQLRKKWDSIGKDVVLLHQFQRGKYCVNLSPFAIKVETYLRLAKIKYEVDSNSPFGPKKKCPWITLNGEDVGDSEMVIQKLSQHFDVNLDSHLDEVTQAQLEAVRVMADEFVFWIVIAWRYWLDGCVTFLKSQSFPPFLNRAFPYMMTSTIKKRSINQGVGVHSPEEIYQMAKKSCGTLSTILGDSPYFGGDQPSTADCAIFGQLAQLMWNAPGSQYEALVRELYPSLGNYCNRMKDTIFPDWNKLLNPPLE